MLARTLSLLVLLGSAAAAHGQEGGPTLAASALPPLSQRLLLPRYGWDVAGAKLSIFQGQRLLNDDFVASGLDTQLGDVPAAKDLAHHAHHELVWGHALYYGGLVGLIGGVTTVSAGAAQVTDSSLQAGLNATGAILTLVSLAATVAGIVEINAGLAHVLDAVNRYNLAVSEDR